MTRKTHSLKKSLDPGSPGIVRSNHRQESTDIKKQVIDQLLVDPSAILHTLITVAYLIVAVIHYFGWTGDPSLLAALFLSQGVTRATSALKKKGVKTDKSSDK